VKQCLSFFAAHVGVRIAEDEPDSGKEVALAGSIATNDNIGFWGEGFDDGLLLVAVS